MDIEVIKSMWNDQHMELTAISEALGVTRNKIAGLIKRARASGHVFENRTTGRFGHKGHETRSKNVDPTMISHKTSRHEVPPVETKTGPMGPLLPLTILQHEHFHCQAIISEVCAPILYCPWPKVRGAYCAVHCTMMYQPGGTRPIRTYHWRGK